MSYSGLRKRRQTENAVDDALAQVVSLTISDMWHFCDRLTGRSELAAAGWHLSEKRISRRPNAQRDAKMTALNDGGLSYADIAHAYHLDPRTVARACQRFRRRQRGDTESMSPSCLPYDQ